MTAPDRIWIDAWGGNWSPRAGGTQEIEYIRADLIPAALAVPEVRALVEAATALHRDMELFFEADEAADEAERLGHQKDAARFLHMANGRWQGVPAKLDALAAALRGVKP